MALAFRVPTGVQLERVSNLVMVESFSSCASCASTSAAARGWAQVARFLVDHGANVDIVDNVGRSPLDMAITPVNGRAVEGGEAVAEILRSASAKASSTAQVR